MNDPLVIAGVEYKSRLLVGTGKYKDMEESKLATEASEAEIVTIAIRRSNIARIPMSRTCWISCHWINTHYYPILLAVITLKMQFVPVVWHVNYSMVMTWLNWKYWVMKKPCSRMSLLP